MITTVRRSPGASAEAATDRGQDVRPGSSAATTEYGQPGIICACPCPGHRRGRTAGPG